MALIGNRTVLHKSPGRFLSGTVASIERSNFSRAGMLASRFQAVSPVFAGTPSDDALIANTDLLAARMPYTALPLETLLDWAVRWIRGGGRLLNKPTKFEVRDGRY